MDCRKVAAALIACVFVSVAVLYMAASLDCDEQAALHDASEEAMMQQEIDYL